MIRSVQSDSLAREIRDAGDARRFASSIIRARQDEDEFDARAVLSEFPELESYGSAVLDLVYEEFSRRAESGEDFDSEEFANRFPKIRTAVLEHIRAHKVLERCFGNKSPVWPGAGEKVLGCELLEEIGRGAFSRVFLARQAALGGRRVVVKFCPSGDHEAHLLGKLEHEHIVQIHAVESDVARQLSAIVMPFFGRATLRDVIDCSFREETTPRTAAAMIDVIARIDAADPTAARLTATRASSYIGAVGQIMLDVARGLAHAHGKMVLHADIKPSNVLVAATLRAKLLDFNLSHDSGALTNMTGGTVPYMAPEQLLVLVQQGEPTPTVAADLYAFGATFHESLTGKSPYGEIPTGLDRTSLAEWLLHRRQACWESLGSVAPHVPRPICDLIDRCLSDDPRRRPASIDEAVAILEREQRASVRLLRRAQRHPVLTGLVGGLATISLTAAMMVVPFTGSAQNYYEAGHAEFLEHNYEKAVTYFDRADDSLTDEATPEFKIALWYERGRARLELPSGNMYDDVFRDFEQVVGLKPDHAEAHASLGYAYVAPFNKNADSLNATTQFVKARHHFERAHDLGIDTCQLRYDIAYCQFKTDADPSRGISELQELTRESGVPDDVLASAFQALVKWGLTHAKDVDLPLVNVEQLLKHVGHCGDVFVMAGGAYLKRAQKLSDDGDPASAAESVNAALACYRTALQHGVDRSMIDAARQGDSLIRDDPRFLVIEPAGEAIESSAPPPAVLDPLASDAPPR